MTATTFENKAMAAHEKALHCTVASIIPWPLHEFKPGLLPGHYYIKESDTHVPTCIYVTNKTIHYVYLDDTRGSLPARDPSDEVARSIVNDYIASQLGVDESARPGIFWVPGYHEPHEIILSFKDLLSEAQRAQSKWFQNLCKIADDDWTRYRKHNVISDFQREAAKMIGWNPDDHEWMRTEIKSEGPKEVMRACVACNSPVSEKAIICSVCKCVLDPEAFKKLTFAKGV
jgi:hypothetical protein